MKKDIETRADIDDLMKRFYERATNDEIIGYIFAVAELDLEKHLPIIGDFWESLLLGGKNYQKHGRNPLQVHSELNEKTPLLGEHFKRWLEIFRETVDENFVGTRAEFAKDRAAAIAKRMLDFVGREISSDELSAKESPAKARRSR